MASNIPDPSSASTLREGVSNTSTSPTSPSNIYSPPVSPTPSLLKPRPHDSPLQHAGPLSVLFLSCLDHLIRLGASRPLQIDDIPAAPLSHQSESIHATLEACRQKHPKWSFGSILLWAFIPRYIPSAISKTIFAICFLLQPFWIGSLLEFVHDRAKDPTSASSHGHYLFGITSGIVVTP